jgi:hypothetical protein
MCAGAHLSELVAKVDADTCQDDGRYAGQGEQTFHP